MHRWAPLLLLIFPACESAAQAVREFHAWELHGRSAGLSPGSLAPVRHLLSDPLHALLEAT